MRPGTAAKQHALHPCPRARPCFPPRRPGAKPGRAAWNQHPGEKKTSFTGKNKAECKGGVQALWGKPCSGTAWGHIATGHRVCVPTPKLTLCSCLCADRQNTTCFVRQLDGMLLAPGACRPVVRRWLPASSPGPAAHQPCYFRPVTPALQASLDWGVQRVTSGKGAMQPPRDSLWILSPQNTTGQGEGPQPMS